MRKLIALLLIGILLLAGCQPTPENPVVIQKDLEQMLDKAQKNTDKIDGKSLKDQYGIPEAYQYQAQWADGKLNIIADAFVITPDFNTISIYRVKAADFTQEQVDALLNAFFGNQTLYEVQYGVETKDEIMQRILLYKQWKTSGEYASESDQRMIDDSIALLEAAYQNAPEKREDDVVVSDRRLKLKEITDPQSGKHAAYYTGIDVTTDYKVDYTQTAIFRVENNNDMTEAIWHTNNNDSGNVVSGEGMLLSYEASLSYSNPGDTYGSNFDKPISVNEKTVIETPEVLAKLKTTPAQAKELVEQTLASAGINNMAVTAMFLMNDGGMGDSDATTAPVKHYAYKLYLCRTVNGIPVSYISGNTGMNAFNEVAKGNNSNAIEDAALSSYIWHYETINAMVDDTGVLSFEWKSPLNIGEMLVENAALLSFTDISAIFEKLMKIQYEPRANDEYLKSCAINIERVALEYQRIIEQNSNQSSLLVPVWNFYGTCATTDITGEEQSMSSGGDSTYQFPLASINAIDGSIIDITKGY